MNTTFTSGGSTGLRRFGRTARALTSVVAVASTVGMGLVVLGGTASATSLVSRPTFDCYHTNGADLVVNPLFTNWDAKTTVWRAMVEEDTGGQWILVATSALQVDSDNGNSSTPDYFQVPLNKYYIVLIAMQSTGDAAPQAVYATAVFGGAPSGSEICHT